MTIIFFVLSLNFNGSPQHGIQGVKVILVGNKVDLEDQRKVSTRRGQKVGYIGGGTARVEVGLCLQLETQCLGNFMPN